MSTAVGASAVHPTLADSEREALGAQLPDASDDVTGWTAVRR